MLIWLKTIKKNRFAKPAICENLNSQCKMNRQFISEFVTNAENHPKMQAVVLLGSIARKEDRDSSDIDLFVLVKPEFKLNELERWLNSKFDLRHIVLDYVKQRGMLFLKNFKKVDLMFKTELEGLKKYYLGSEINDNKLVSDSVLFDKTSKVMPTLQLWVNNKIDNPPQLKDEIIKHTNTFLFSFNSLSSQHKRSDAYRSYFSYNIALQHLFQMKQIIEEGFEMSFLPKMFLYKRSREYLKQFEGTLNLEKVNDLKRQLLDEFYVILFQSKVLSETYINKIKGLCEDIYQRDYLWNFRDVSNNCNLIKPGVLLRSSSLTRYQNEDFFRNWIAEQKVKKVIDLRHEEEVEDNPYNSNWKSIFTVVNTPIDPRNQSDWFKQTYHQGDNIRIAYRYYAAECKEQLKNVVNEIATLNNGDAALIHCFAGKDRSGVVVALLMKLVGIDNDTIYNEYLASEMDTDVSSLDAFFATIDAENFLVEIDQSIIEKLKAKLLA